MKDGTKTEPTPESPTPEEVAAREAHHEARRLRQIQRLAEMKARALYSRMPRQ